MFHFLTTRDLAQVVREGAIGLKPFSTIKGKGLCLHILLSCNPACDCTTEAIEQWVQLLPSDFKVSNECCDL